LAPAGYFLFNVVNAGIPSPAVWIHIGWKSLSLLWTPACSCCYNHHTHTAFVHEYSIDSSQLLSRFECVENKASSSSCWLTSSGWSILKLFSWSWFHQVVMGSNPSSLYTYEIIHDLLWFHL
jgi:hypothetical protein